MNEKPTVERIQNKEKILMEKEEAVRKDYMETLEEKNK